MKLFDFKFLILLGLTLVVYFMYKEIDIQRERIQRLEDLYKKLVDKDEHVCDLENDDVLSLPPPPQKNTDKDFENTKNNQEYVMKNMEDNMKSKEANNLK